MVISSATESFIKDKLNEIIKMSLKSQGFIYATVRSQFFEVFVVVFFNYLLVATPGLMGGLSFLSGVFLPTLANQSSSGLAQGKWKQVLTALPFCLC